MDIYKFTDYRKFLKKHIESLPNNGHGELAKIAKNLRISTTMISQVIKGSKHLSQEMAADLADYLKLNSTEFEYFILLIDYERAGSQNLKLKLKDRIEKIKKHYAKIGSRILTNKELSIEQKVQYYSDWTYAAVFNMAATGELNDLNFSCTKLGITKLQLNLIIEFLLEVGLLKKSGQNFETGQVSIHVDNSSPFLRSYLTNWRIRAIQKLDPQNPTHLHLTAAMSMSKDVAAQVRQDILKMIESINKEVMPSESEVVRCLNIDWFDF